MAIRELAGLTWEDVRDMDRPHTVALLAVGALEAHGPHLPLATDVIIAEHMAQAAAARLEREGFAVLLLPSLPFSPAPFGVGFPGTVSIAPETLTALLVDLARDCTRQSYAALGIANAHLDPAHLRALAAATARCAEERLLPLACPDLSVKPWATRLTDEFKSGACHAGQFEGSIVLAARPDLVRDQVRRALPSNPRSLSRAIRDGAQRFEDAGGPAAYFGSPAAATAEEGRHTIETLGNILAEAVLHGLNR
jgi:creatinine amidohydrolase